MIRAAVPVAVAALASAIAAAPLCIAEPTDTAPPTVPAPDEVRSTAEVLTPVSEENPISSACKLFDAAISVAAVNYEDFAYATAGNGNYVDYQDPNVLRTNVVGRTALRQAAAAALSASRTDGLPPEVAGPMRTWSLRATKLVVLMGLHGGGDSLNGSVSDLNVDAHEAQLACARAQLG